jgi:DNA primase
VISTETIQRVRDQVKIAAVVGERVKLERRGRSLTGLCPFHKEKSPSFHVNDERGFYYCFGCHASGDAIKFVQELEGLSFVEAVRELAEGLGIDIVETRSEQDRRQDNEAKRKREELFSVNQAAATYFQQCLKSHELRQYAHAELARRGMDVQHLTESQKQALEAFRIGYAPAGWDGLANYLKSAGLSLAAAEKVGLVAPRRNGGGYYDRFRHRLMFAVLDVNGKTCAFSGRMLDNPTAAELRNVGASETNSEERIAKYINSPETPIYKKRETVFGLHQARGAIRDKADCIIVEGNFDVVSLHAAGVPNVVAPLGTAFTEEQATLIRRYSPQVTLLFDADSAGKRASIASREPARAAGLTIRVASLPQGHDPDSFVREKGPTVLQQCVRAASGMLEYLIETTLDGLGSNTPQAQSDKIREVLAIIAAEQDETLRGLAQTHADRIAARLGIKDVNTFTSLQRSVARAASSPVPRSGGEQTRNPGSNSQTRQPAQQMAGPPNQRRMLPPERARSVQHDTAIEQELFGALVEYPSLMQEPEIAALLCHATGPLVLAIANLAHTADDLDQHIELFEQPFQRIIRERLAAPRSDTIETARNIVNSNLTKLSQVEAKARKAALIEALHQARRSGDVELELELLAQMSPRAGR